MLSDNSFMATVTLSVVSIKMRDEGNAIMNDMNEEPTWTGAWSSLWNGFPMRERIARLGKDLPTT